LGKASGSSGGGAFQLVSLNRDLKLRLHAIEPAHLNACAYNPSEDTPSKPAQSPGAPHSEASRLISGDEHRPRHQQRAAIGRGQDAGEDKEVLGADRVSTGTAAAVVANSSSRNSNKSSERSEGYFLSSKLSLESLKADLYPQTHHSTGLGDFGPSGTSSTGGLSSRGSFGNIVDGGPGATAAALYHGSSSSGGTNGNGGGNGSGLLLVGGNQSMHSSIIHDEVVTLLDTVATAHALEQRLPAQLNNNSSNNSLDALGGSAGVWAGVNVRCETSYADMAQKRTVIFVVNLEGSAAPVTATPTTTNDGDGNDSSSAAAVDSAPSLESDSAEGAIAAAEALEGVVAERDLDGSVHAETAEVHSREDDGKVDAEEAPLLLAMALKVAVVFPPRYPSDAAAMPTFALAWHRPESTSIGGGGGSSGNENAPNEKEGAVTSAKASDGNLSSAAAAASATSVSSSSAAALALLGGSAAGTKPAGKSSGWPAPHVSLAPKAVLSRLLRSMERVTRRCAAEASLCVGSAVAQLAQGLHELQNQVANASRSLAAAAAAPTAAGVVAELGIRDNTAPMAAAAHAELHTSRSSVSDAAHTAMGSTATVGAGTSSGVPGGQVKATPSSAQMKRQAALPAPRTSCAVFSGNGSLLFFGPAKVVKAPPAKTSSKEKGEGRIGSSASPPATTSAASPGGTQAKHTSLAFTVRTYRDLLTIQGSSSSYGKGRGGVSYGKRRQSQKKKPRSPSLSSSAADASAWGAVLPLNHPGHSLGPTPAARSQANLTLGDLALGTSAGAFSATAAAAAAAGYTKTGKKEAAEEQRRRKMAVKKWNVKKGSAHSQNNNMNAFSSSSASDTSDSDESISDEDDSSPSETSDSVSDSSSSRDHNEDDGDDEDDTASRSSLSSAASSTETMVSASAGRGRDRLRLRRVRLQPLPQFLVPGHPALASILRLPNPFNPTAPPRLRTGKSEIVALSTNDNHSSTGNISHSTHHINTSSTEKLTDRSAHALAAIVAVAQRCRLNAKAVTKLSNAALPTSDHHPGYNKCNDIATMGDSPSALAAKSVHAKNKNSGAAAARVWLLAATACEGLLARAGVAVGAAASTSACSHTDSSASITSSGSSSRRHAGVGSGTSGYSSCGAALVQRSLLALAHVGDVQTLAAVVATLRASYWTRGLLVFPKEDGHGGVVDSSAGGGAAGNGRRPLLLDVEVWLAAYGDLLFRWGCHAERLEVLKYVQWPPNFAPRASPLYHVSPATLQALNQGRRTNTTSTTTVVEPALLVAAAAVKKLPVKSFSDGALNTSAAREEAATRRGSAAAVTAASAEASYAELRRNDNNDEGRGAAPVGGWYEAQLETTRMSARVLGATALAIESLSAASTPTTTASPTSSTSSPSSSTSLTVDNQDTSAAAVAATSSGDAVLNRPFAADVVDLQRICFGFVCASCGDITSEAPLCRPALALDDSNSPTALSSSSSSSQQNGNNTHAQTRRNSGSSKSRGDGDNEGKNSAASASSSSAEADRRRGSIESPSGAVKMNRAARKRQARIEQASGLSMEGNTSVKPAYGVQGKATGMLSSSSPSSLAGRMFNKQATTDPAGDSSSSSLRANTSTSDASIMVARPLSPPPLLQVPFASPLRLSATSARATAVVSTEALRSSSSLRPMSASSYNDDSSNNNATATKGSRSRSSSGSRVVAHVALQQTFVTSYAQPAAPGSFLSGQGGARNGAGSYSGVDGRGGGGTYLPAKPATGLGQGASVSTRAVWKPPAVEPHQSLALPTRAYQSTGNLNSLAMSSVGRQASAGSYKEGPQSAGRMLNRGKSFGATGSSSGGGGSSSSSSSMDSGSYRTASAFGQTLHSSSSSGGGCGQFSSACSLCRLPVRGSFLLCTGCGHGGHPAHLAAWFYGQPASGSGGGGTGRGAHNRCGVALRSPTGGTSASSPSFSSARTSLLAPQSVCPTGCGCRCPEVMAATWSATRPAVHSA